MTEYSFEIPILGSDEVIEINIEQLPTVDEVIGILDAECSSFHTWINAALAYRKKKQMDDFFMIIETALKKADCDHQDYENPRMRALDLLAAHYVQEANREKSEDMKHELFKKASDLYTITDKFIMYDENHLLGRAYFCMLEGGKLDQANAQFNFILNQLPENIPSLMGKACIAFNKKNYRGALSFYATALLINPNGPAGIRLGMAHCFLKLKYPEKALLAFERAVQLDPNCIGALIGVAILKLSFCDPASRKAGIEMLSKAYTMDNTNPMVLNHLANHFFFKKDYEKVHHLAMHAFRNTENDTMRAESCYHLARNFHVQDNYDQAFQYYYQSTQLAPPNFVLPHYGLGQMYLYKDDIKNALQCFEKVLKIQPDNGDSMKILGSLYAKSGAKAKRELAKTYLKKYTEQNPYDSEAWIIFAQLLEGNDFRGSLNAYETASTIYSEQLKAPVPAEILTNMAALHYRMGNIQLAMEKQTEALEVAKGLTHVDNKYYNSISVTMKYNLARLNEAMSCDDVADKLYKDILKEHPNYIDCYLRLGCMARDRGLIFVASDFFKDALNVQKDNPEARSILGNLHLAKMQFAPGQKNFDMILKNPLTKADSYSMLALANCSLQMLYQPSRNKDKRQKYETRAQNMYYRVLRNDPRNIWATNGIGCVLAHKGYVTEARDIFSQVREATADFSDVWLNIAHIYVEQNQINNAIHIYENCIKKFYQHHNVEVIQYLARAYARANNLEQAKTALLKARHVAPQDSVLLFNIALVISNLARIVLADKKATLKNVLQAVHELELAQKNFHYLSLHGNGKLLNPEAARFKSNQCKDLISKAQYHVGRVRQIDAKEKLMRQKQEDDRNAFRRKQEEDRKKLEEMEKTARFENSNKRREFMEKNKNLLIISEPKPDKKRKKSNVRPRKDEHITNTDDDTENAPPKKQINRKKGRNTSVCSNKENYPKNGKMIKEESFKVHHKIISKELISSSESESECKSAASLSHNTRKRSLTPNSSEIEGAKRQKQISTTTTNIESLHESLFGLDSPSPSVSKNCSPSRENSHSRSSSRSGSAHSKSRSRSGSAHSKSRSRSGSAQSKSYSRSGSRSRSSSKSSKSRIRYSRFRENSTLLTCGVRSRSRSNSASPLKSASRSSSASPLKSPSRSRSRSNSGSRSKSRSGSPISKVYSWGTPQ